MPSEKSSPPTKIAAGKYELDKKLGAGCFGEVWRGKDTTTGDQVAVKFEDLSGHALQLEHEVEVLKAMEVPTQPQGFTKCFYAGREGRFYCMVIDILGKSVEERLSERQNRFKVTTAVLIAEQVLRRIEYLHSKCIIHRDIKPENFMFGIGDKIHHIYLIDFGLSKKYYDSKHLPMRMKLSLTGTARYASINAHKGVEQSRRDDLEAIGHMLIYFLRGSLPWSGLDAKTQEEKYRRICEKKISTNLDQLCVGFPDAFKTFLKTAREMEFKERPNYKNLRKMFQDLRDQEGPLEDHDFEFLQGKDLGTLTSVLTGLQVRQPDDQDVSHKCSYCCLFGTPNVKD